MKYPAITLFVISLLFACAAAPKIQDSTVKPAPTDINIPTDNTSNVENHTGETYSAQADDKEEAALKTEKAKAADANSEKKGWPELFTDVQTPPETTIPTGDSDTARQGAGTSEATHTAPTGSGLTAGFADDNKQFNYFLSFLEKYRTSIEHIELPIEERIILSLKDEAGRSLPDAQVTVRKGNNLLVTGKSYADGTFTFYPLLYDAAARQGKNQPATYKAQVTFNQQQKELNFERSGPRTVDVVFGTKRPVYKNIALDMVFIMDTTGSMGEEIERLKTTIDIINLNLASLATRPALRFGMVLYKDKLDEEYATRVIPLTSDLKLFQKQLAEVTAEGGGDTPEDLQAALEAAIKNLNWNGNGIRLAFIITDAPPHIFTYNPVYTYRDAGLAAKAGAIKLFSVGTGGLNLNGEFVLRQISQLTQAKYIFLTRGETGESEGGKEGSVSHHTGANFQTDKLETIIMRLAKEELACLLEKPPAAADEYFQAVKIPEETKQATLKELFDRVLAQLVDYASYKLAPATPAALIPLSIPESKPEAGTPVALQSRGSSLRLNAEYFSEEVLQALVRNPAFKAVDRQNLQSVLKELELQWAGLTDESQAARIGQVLGAKLLVTGVLYQKEKNYELFLKLLNVETAEIIAVTKAHIAAELGL